MSRSQGIVLEIYSRQLSGCYLEPKIAHFYDAFRFSRGKVPELSNFPIISPFVGTGICWIIGIIELLLAPISHFREKNKNVINGILESAEVLYGS